MAHVTAVAELAAILATALAAISVLPQLRRVVVGGDGRGVSLSGALLGVVNETAWIAYTVRQELWSAAPEAVLMAVANVVLVVWLLRTGAGRWRRAVHAAGLWAGVLAAITVVGGPPALAIALGLAFAVQVAPAVWTAWRTPSPTGVAGATWAMLLAESFLWGVYGVHHADPATSTLAVVGTVAGTAMLLRKAVTHVRRAAPDIATTSAVPPHPPSTADAVTQERGPVQADPRPA